MLPEDARLGIHRATNCRVGPWPAPGSQRCFDNRGSQPRLVGSLRNRLRATGTRGVTLYEAGDCRYFPGFRDIGKRYEIDGALINYARNPSRELTPFMEPEEVVQAAKDLRARRVLLKHWDLWESMFAPPEPMVELLTAEGVDAVAVAQGDRFSFGRDL